MQNKVPFVAAPPLVADPPQVHFPLVNIIPIPGQGVLVEIAENSFHSERYLFTGEVLARIVKAGREALSAGQDIVRVVEKSRVG